MVIFVITGTSDELKEICTSHFFFGPSASGEASDVFPTPSATPGLVKGKKIIGKVKTEYKLPMINGTITYFRYP